MYSNAKYTCDVNKKITGISVLINDLPSFVPIDPANSDYQNIMQLVEEDKLVIQPADNEEK